MDRADGQKKMRRDKKEDLLLPSGGYQHLKSFQLARLIYDITVLFTELYIPANSRPRDQMVQAARSGVQNIAEGSVDAATSTKLELNITSPHLPISVNPYWSPMRPCF